MVVNHCSVYKEVRNILLLVKWEVETNILEHQSPLHAQQRLPIYPTAGLENSRQQIRYMRW